jgi:hypothetical protein
VIVTVSFDVAPVAAVVGSNVKAQVGAAAIVTCCGAVTVSVAATVVVIASTATPLALEESAPVDTTKLPELAAVTSADTVHVDEAGTVPLESCMLVEPGAAMTVPPVHVVDGAGFGATTRPADSVAVNARAVVSVVLARLSMVNVTLERSPATIVAGASCAVSAGGVLAGSVVVVVVVVVCAELLTDPATRKTEPSSTTPIAAATRRRRRFVIGAMLWARTRATTSPVTVFTSTSPPIHGS